MIFTKRIPKNIELDDLVIILFLKKIYLLPYCYLNINDVLNIENKKLYLNKGKINLVETIDNIDVKYSCFIMTLRQAMNIYTDPTYIHIKDIECNDHDNKIKFIHVIKYISKNGKEKEYAVEYNNINNFMEYLNDNHKKLKYKSGLIYPISKESWNKQIKHV